MDPMTDLINGLPQPPQPDMGGVIQQQPSMYAGMQQQPQAPAPQQQPQYPQAPMPQVAPQWQQPVPQPPAAPPYGQPAAYPQYPQAPMMPQLPAAPIVPQFPSQQPQQTMPEWAQELVQSVNQIQQSDGGGGQLSFNPDEPWSSTNKPRSWEEMRKANETLATQKAQEIVTQTMQQQQVQQQQQQQAEQQANQAIDQSFNRLRLSGALPPVQNPNDPNDAGKQAERELLGYTLAMGGKSATDMEYSATSLLQRHQQGQFYDVKSGQMIQRRGMSAAAMAPIAGGAPVMGPMGGYGGPTQSQLAQGGRDLNSLMQAGMAATQ